jgi:hypothetical protein
MRGLPRAPRLCLHAAALELVDPGTGEALCLEAPFPEELAAYWEALAQELPGR